MTLMFQGASKAALLSKPQPFFATPEAAGRRIVCGFTYMKRIGKSSSTDLWFPDAVKEAVAERILAGDASVLDEFRVEWAAVRQFELLQESGNLAIEDLKVDDFKKAFQNLMKMRAGGYRVTVITLGRYVEPAAYDELRILDRRLQDEITRLIHMLYLDEQSAAMSGERRLQLRTEQWRCADALPHVAMALGERALFAKGNDQRARNMSESFFRLLEMLPRRHIVHDVAVGLSLPEAVAQKNWVYIAAGENQFAQFHTALGTVFRGFDAVTLSGMPEQGVKPTMHHMRGYGDRLSPAAEAADRAAALALH